MRAILVGAGGATRAVLARLGERWEVVVIDGDRDRLERTATIRPVETVQGDGSSRVVIERAGLADADAVVAAAGDDRVTQEVCRIALEAGVPRIVAVVDDPELLGEYRRLGVVAVSPNRLAARHVEINLEPRRVASAAFANGRAEAVEFRISPDSPLHGRAIQDLGRMPWLIAAVLRGDELIVPHGSTELRADDLVTVVGPAADYASMVATFTGGQARFPLQYGRHAALAIDPGEEAERLIAEAAVFVRATAAASLIILHDDPGTLDPERAATLTRSLDRAAELVPGAELRTSIDGAHGLQGLLQLAARESVGVVIVPRPRGRIATVRVLDAIRRAGVPALLATGTPAYRAIVTPARDSIGGWRAGWTAIDLASRSGLPLEALGVVPPPFLAGETEVADARRAVARIRTEASVQGVSVSGRIEVGNPVRVFGALLPDQLAVLGLGDRALNVVAPGLTGHIVAGIRSSVVVIPDQERR